LTSLASSGAAPAVTVPAPVFTAVAASVPYNTRTGEEVVMTAGSLTANTVRIVAAHTRAKADQIGAAAGIPTPAPKAADGLLRR
jgi:hypothetical protein